MDEFEERLDGRPRTAYELSVAVFPDAERPTQRRFAVAETLAHLERLVREGRAAPAGAGGLLSYTAP